MNPTSTTVGGHTLLIAEILFGSAPAARFVAPAVADWQAAHAQATGFGERFALRARYSAQMLLSFVFLFSRVESDGALARLWPALLAATVGILALRRTAGGGLSSLQLAWLGIGVAAFGAALFPTPRNERWSSAASALFASSALVLAAIGERWLRVPGLGLLVAPSALLVPLALAASVTVATARGWSRAIGAGLLVLLCIAWTRTEEPAAILVTGATVLGAFAATGTRGEMARAGLTSLALGVPLALLAAPSSLPWARGVELSAAIQAGGWTGGATLAPALADAHTDFILASTAHAYGVLGLVALTLAFAVLLWMLARQSRSADANAAAPAGALLGALASQILLHAGGELGVVPLLGAPLPLASYGGSAIVGFFISLGLGAASARRDRLSLSAA